RPLAPAVDRIALRPSGIRSRRCAPRRNRLPPSLGGIPPSAARTARANPHQEIRPPASPIAVHAPRAATRPPRRQLARRTLGSSLKPLVGKRDQLRWPFQSERLGGLEIAE